MTEKTPMVIAHRGFSSEFPENTMLAFREARKVGADGFECDLRITADGHVVVFHDDNLKRLCGVGGTIESMNWSDIQKLRVKKSEPIPRLEEILTEFADFRMNLELKPSARAEVLVEAVLRTLTKTRPTAPLLFSSFSRSVLECLKVMDPERRLGDLGILVESHELEKLPDLSEKFEPATWNVPAQVLQAPWAKRWPADKVRPLWIWTLDEPDQWRACLSSPLPVAAIITNKPAGAREFLKQN